MGVGHLDIGEGIGDAKAFNPSPAIQMYGQMLAQRKTKQDADNKYLADTLAKGYDPSGLRNDADRQSYLKQYATIKQTAIDSENEKDPMKKAMALAQVRQSLNDLGTYAEKSKKQGLQEHAWATAYQQNPNNWDDKALDAYRKSKDSEVNSPDTIQDFTTQQRRVDPDKVDKLYQAHKDLLTKNLQYDNGTQTPATVAGKKGAYVVQSRGIPMDGDNGALESTMHWATSQPDVQKSLADRYPNIQDPNPQKELGLRVKQYMADMGDSVGFYDQTKPVFHESYKPEAPDKLFYAHYQYELAHPRPGTEASNQPTPAQFLAQAMARGDAAGGDKFFSLLPKGQYGGAKPHVNIDPSNGVQTIQFPPQIDQKAVEFNKEQKAKWAKENPGEPFDPTDKDYKLKQEEIKPKKDYPLNPASPTYLADFAQMAKEQNVNLSQLNQIEGVKGGHGQLPQAQIKQPDKQQPKSYTVTTGNFKGTHPSSAIHEKAVKAGVSDQEYINWLNKQ